MKTARYIAFWTLVCVVGLFVQFYLAKLATETEKDPDLVETVQFTPEAYPEVAARITAEGLQRHITELSSLPSRLTGTKGAEAAAGYIEEQFRALGVGEPVVERFPVVVPVHDRCEIKAGGRTYAIHPLMPNGVCPAAFPEDGFATRLVFGGYGSLAEIEGKDVQGAMVVLETGGREEWVYLIDIGAKGVIFVEREAGSRAMGYFTQTGSSQDVPRFWMTKAEGEPLLQRLRKGDIEATLYSDARWERREGLNVWVDIPWVSTAPHNEREVVVFSAYYDTGSFVPGLAPCAEQTCSIATLLELAKVIRDFPFEKRVRLLATAGHFQALEGVRRYVWEKVGQYESPMRDVSPQDHAAFFTLDLSTGSECVGLFCGGFYFQQMANNLKPRVSDLGRRASLYVNGDPEEGLTGIAEALGVEPASLFVDTINPTGGKDWITYLPTAIASEHEVPLLAGVPALSFVTTNDSRMYAGGPNDTEVHIDRLLVQARLLACLLPNAFNVEGRYLKRSLPRSICRLGGRAVSFDPRAGYLPDQPLPGALVVSQRRADTPYPLAGVEAQAKAMTDEEGRFEFVGLATSKESPLHLHHRCFAPYVVERGRITWAPDFGRMGKESYPLTMVPVQKEMEVMCVAFECKALEIYNTFDPRNYNYLANLAVFEAASNSRPSVYGTTLIEPSWWSFQEPTATVFAPAGTRLKVTASAGAMNQRLLLLNVPEEIPEGEQFNTGSGFLVDKTPAIHRTNMQSAQDMWRLDDSRIRFFGAHGIENARVNELHERAGEAIKKADDHWARKEYRAFYTESRRALSLESRAYPDVVGMANDTVRGLIFYLALLLPFAFAMERLFLAGRRIETRIAGIVAFFLGMFFILRFTHPGFLIVLSPMVVLLGFIVAVLSSTIISIVMGKLESLVSKRKLETEGEHKSGVQAVSGFTVALEMGIANMRRRRARTVLTSITIVVLTFSVLSFVSVTERIRMQRYEYDEGATPYRGLLLRTQNWAPFPFQLYASLRNELGERAEIALRRWYYGAQVQNQSFIEIQGAGTIRTLRALVGLTTQEQHFMDVGSALLGKSRWLSPEIPGTEPPTEVLIPLNLAEDFFAPREEVEDGTIGRRLSRAEKDRIANAAIGKQVALLGREMTVVGVFDWAVMNDLLDIDGESLTPFDPVQMEKKAQEEGVPDPEEIQRYIHHSFKDVAILQERTLGNLGGDVRSIAIRPTDPADLEPLVESLVQRMDYIFFANLDGEATLLSSRDATSISEYWNLLILTLIAALIVFNTMLGSVYERTKEIGTYTALGIAPSHIGRLFLVEAGVFAILGVMAGYVLGQSVSRVVGLFDLPLLNALNLNYSSLASVGACILVMSVVLFSAIYPARKASEIGVPDIERRWKLPRTKEARIQLDLPFTVSFRESQGLVAFLKEYLDSHVDVSVGRFYVENIQAGPEVLTGRGTGVKGQFWLTPFDLGVSQYATILLRPIEGMDVCGAQVLLERLSGDAGSWRRANSRFVTDMRSQFLIWRNLSPENRADYVRRGEDYALA